MKNLILAACLMTVSGVPAAAQALRSLTAYDGGKKTPIYAPASGAANIDFCARGKFLIFTGNCVLPKGSPLKDTMSPKACADVGSVLISGLSVLYPYAKVYTYSDLEPEAVYGKLQQPSVLGFFTVGEGNYKGGMLTGESGKAVYPSKDACVSKLDVFGGFTSHSGYSPDSPAPKEFRRHMLARVEFVENGEGAPVGSWMQVCGPALSLAYPTRTFAGRIKGDVQKLVNTLMDMKREQAFKALESICGACDQYVKAGYPLAKLCPPNSDVCKVKKIVPGSEKLVMDNYCLVLHPDYVKPSRQ